LFERLQKKEIQICWHALDSRCVSAVRISLALPMAQQIAEQHAVVVSVGLDKGVRLAYKFSVTSLGSIQELRRNDDGNQENQQEAQEGEEARKDQTPNAPVRSLPPKGPGRCSEPRIFETFSILDARTSLVCFLTVPQTGILRAEPLFPVETRHWSILPIRGDPKTTNPSKPALAPEIACVSGSGLPGKRNWGKPGTGARE
jgi:hypothetical protein